MAKRKGINVGVLVALAMSILMFVVLGVIASVNASILAGVQATQTTNTVAYNITSKALEGGTNIGNQLPLMATIIVFGAIIALLLGIFLWKRGKGGF